MPNDPVNHPAHYTRFPVEVITITERLTFNAGNAVKYLCRAGAKNPGELVQDLQKAAWYVAREIERVKGGETAPKAKRGRPAKAATAALPVDNVPDGATPPAKRRGRPKGSKNRPKDAAPAPVAEMAVQAPDPAAQ